jgi:parallel beta-helix repeat protein
MGCGSASLAPDATIAVPGQGTGATYYVSNSGRDSNSGASASPFATIGHAAGVARAGDVVNVLAGTYASFTVTNSGTAAAYVSYQGYPAGTHPVIQEASSDWMGIAITADYISVNGFEVIGDAKSITLSQASNENLADPTLNDSGIVAGSYSESTVFHHILVTNNIVHDVDEDGISIGHSDYVTVAGNTVYDNSKWSGYAGSGISSTPKDSDSNTGYKIFIEGNLLHDNVELVINTVNGTGLGITDGEGIIVDSSAGQNYGGRTLITNNVAYDNGSTGIQVFASNHVDVVNNTTYMNGTNVSRGEIYAQDASDVNVYNNNAFSTPGQAPSGGFTASGYNDYFNVQPKALSTGDIVANPLFVNAASHDFRLQVGSPAIDVGTSHLAPTTDFASTARPQGGGFDIGAYEYVACR